MLLEILQQNSVSELHRVSPRHHGEAWLMPQDTKQPQTQIEKDQQAALEGVLRLKQELGMKTSGSSKASNTATSHEDEAIELTQRELKTEIASKKQSVEQREKEAKDRRSQLLNAVRVSAPEINKPLVETFERLSLEKQQFAQKELVRLFKNDAQLQSATDFFDLNLAQREDLLDRIGFYKGLIIDHSLSNPVETGFREVLKRHDSANPGPCKVATLLYRKPNFSGYFENYYTSSESLHQVQKNGVTNISTSLNVAAGTAATVGVGISGAYHNAESQNGGVKGQTIYTTANFFLPKVELSFDESEPCASDEFEYACNQALLKGGVAECFKELVKVLGSFGHFVSTQTLVGGRLFATDVKELTGTEKDASMTTSFAAKVKVGVETWSASVEAGVSADYGRQTDTRSKDVDETQTYTIHAVGGEGTVVEQAGRWAESLYEYQRWAAVQREKLIPSIEVLSEELSKRVWDMLKQYVSSNTTSHLTGECNAYFLFYGAYQTEVGYLARPDYVIIKNLASQHCLSLKGETPQNPELSAKLFDWTRQQLWRVTPEGHLVSAIPVKSGFPGHKKSVEFALSVLEPVPSSAPGPTVKKDSSKDTDEIPAVKIEPKKESLLLGLSELGSSPYQRWEFTGRGEIHNIAYGADYVLSLPLNGKPEFRLRGNTLSSTGLWRVDEATPDDLKNIDAYECYGKLVHPTGLVLSVEGCEDTGYSFGRSEQRRVLLQPDIGGRHQLWNRKQDGTIVSAIRIGSDNPAQSSDVYLTLDPQKNVIARGKSLSTEALKCDTDDMFYVGEVPANKFYLYAAVRPDETGQPVSMDAKDAHIIRYHDVAVGIVPASFSSVTPSGNMQTCEKVKTVDKRELKVDGYLTGIEFILEKRGKDRKLVSGEYHRLKMKISAQRLSGSATEVWEDEPDKDKEDRDFLHDYGEVCVDDRFLILPEDPIYAIRLRVHESPKKHLAFEYQLVDKGPWFGLAGMSESARTLNIDEIKVPGGMDAEAANKTKIRGVALDYDPAARTLRPKVLRRITG